MLDNITAIGWFVLGLSALLIGLSKTGIPGAGILPIALAAMVLPAKGSTGMLLPMLVVGDIFAVAYWRRHAVWSHLLMLLPFAAIGIVIGCFFMRMVTDAQLKPIIGGVILVMLVLNWWRRRGLDARIEQSIGGEAERGQACPPYMDSPSPERGQACPPYARQADIQRWILAVFVGLLAGTVTMMANAAGPIMIIYLLAMRLPKQEFVGTAAWYFLILNTFKIPFSGGLGLINSASITLNLILLPMIVIGAIAGVRLLPRIPQKGFNSVVQALAGLGAAWLVVSTWVQG